MGIYAWMGHNDISHNLHRLFNCAASESAGGTLFKSLNNFVIIQHQDSMRNLLDIFEFRQRELSDPGDLLLENFSLCALEFLSAAPFCESWYYDGLSGLFSYMSVHLHTDESQ